MRPEQLKWTDEQWAAHLGCAVQRVPLISAYVTKNYFPGIAKHSETGMYVFCMTKRDVSSSGAERVIPLLSSNKEFEDLSKAIKYANQEILPRLELTKAAADMMGMPTRALQMLHINEKQK